MRIKHRIFKLILILMSFVLATTFTYAIGFDAEKTYESVFAIYTDEGFGSGFAVGPNSVITNAHVVYDGAYVTVVSYSGTEQAAEIFAIDTQLDLALLIVNDANYAALELGKLEDVRVGDDVCAIGTPEDMSLGWTLTKGVISSKSRVIEGEHFIQIDAAINPGNSGGPLLNDEGVVIGVNTRKNMESEGIGFSIPVDTVKSFLKDLDLSMDENGRIEDVLKTNADTLEYIESSNDGDIEELELMLSREKHNNKILRVAMCLSAMLNIALVVIMLINKKKANNTIYQNQYMQFDNSDRTDFEIEIEK